MLSMRFFIFGVILLFGLVSESTAYIVRADVSTCVACDLKKMGCRDAEPFVRYYANHYENVKVFDIKTQRPSIVFWGDRGERVEMVDVCKWDQEKIDKLLIDKGFERKPTHPLDKVPYYNKHRDL